MLTEADEETIDKAIAAARYGGATRQEIFFAVKATLDEMDLEAGADEQRRRLRIDTQPLPSNRTEALFAAGMRERGWMLCKRGWPDFLCMREKDGHVIVVEVKPRSDRRLRREQAIVLGALAAHGVPVARWAPSCGLVRGGFIQITAEP
jgi:hypothetical protein